MLLPVRAVAGPVVLRCGGGANHAVHHWQSFFHPGDQTSFERSHAREPQPLHLERHPGARRFAGSSTHQDELALEWKGFGALFDLFGKYVDRVRDRPGVMKNIKGMAKIQHHGTGVVPGI